MRHLLTVAVLLCAAPSHGQVGTQWSCGGNLCSVNRVVVSSGCTCSNGTLTLSGGGGGSPSGPAGGDLAGTYPNPTVAGIAGQSVTGAATTPGQVLAYAGANALTYGGNILINNNASALFSSSGVTWQATSGSTGATAGYLLKASGAFNSASIPLFEVDDTHPVLKVFALPGESGILLNQGGNALAGIAATANTIIFVDSSLGSNVTLTSGSNMAGSIGSTSMHWSTIYVDRMSNSGSSVVVSDWAASGGWGSTAALSNPSGVDAHGTISITTGGSAITANPTLALTFHDGTWGAAPFCWAKQEVGALGTIVNITESTSPTVLTITFNSTPGSGVLYTFSYLCFGAN